MSDFTYCDDTYSDLHKDVYGFRPRDGRWQRMSCEERQCEWDSLCAQLKEQCAQQAEREKQSVIRFEALIAGVIGNGAKDRATALRWIMQAEDVENDPAYLCYALGLPYAMASQIQADIAA